MNAQADSQTGAATHGASASPFHAWIAAAPGWRTNALAAAAGAVATLGHAPFHIVPAFVIGITVLVWLIDAAAESARPRRAAFARAFFFATGHFISGTYWISSAFLVDSQSWGPLWGVPAALALGAGLALFWGGAFALGIGLWTRDWRRIATFTLIVSAAELTRGHVFGGFPWNLPGYIWTAGEPVSQFAASVGIYGLSIVTLLVAAAPACLLDEGRGVAARFGPFLAACLAIGLLWGAGLDRIARAPIAQPGETPIVRVADAGISQADKWVRRPDQEWRVAAAYAAISGDPRESRAAIVVWPEGAVPAVNFFLTENPDMLAALGQMLGDRVLIAGFSRRERGADGETLYYNSAGVIDGVSGEARLAQIYDKHRLVPFGEFIPLWSLTRFLNIAPLQQIGAGFEAGPRPGRLIIPDAPPATALICYEAIFPGLTPRGAERPGWIVNVTNDAWFGRGTGPWQHYNMARYRAIEEGLPLVRAASGGVSAIVDATGRPVRETGLEGGAAEAQLPAAFGSTLYARWGPHLAGLLIILIIVLRFAPKRRNRKA